MSASSSFETVMEMNAKNNINKKNHILQQTSKFVSNSLLEYYI